MDEQDQKFMRQAIDAGKLSEPEDGRPHPKVGAVIALNGEVLATTWRGKLSKGDHAEYGALERVLVATDLREAVLYTTLEPCTSRRHPKAPCATRVVARLVKKVFIGMLDPNPEIYGKGYASLEDSGCKVFRFPAELVEEIERDNSTFAAQFLGHSSFAGAQRRLDDWYQSINRTYWSANFYRDASSLFSHLVEIMGGLSLLATEKKKAEVDPKKYLAKAVAWWLALCAKVGVRSPESLLWHKFPYACPYCGKCPHQDQACRLAKKASHDPNWEMLRELGSANSSRRPVSLGAWQRMFHDIYEVTQNDRYDVIFGRFTEELGELAEAVRVHRLTPSYFLSEAADVFAWLMRLANMYEFKSEIEPSSRGELIEKMLVAQYPDKCIECEQVVCMCPPILPKTLGRIAHEGPRLEGEDEDSPFLTPAEAANQFQIGSAAIQVGSATIIATPAATGELAVAIGEICDGFSRRPVSNRLKMAIARIGELAREKVLHQSSVDDLLRVLKHASDNDRATTLELAGQASGQFADGLQQALEKLGDVPPSK